MSEQQEQAAGQYLAYTFFRVRPDWRLLPVEERAAGKDAFAEVIEEFAPRFDYLGAYSTTGVRPPTIRPVSEDRQAGDYVTAIHLAACQPLVRMLVFFHVTDETALTGLQTGLFYPNRRPKRSLGRVAVAAESAERGQVKCRS